MAFNHRSVQVSVCEDRGHDAVVVHGPHDECPLCAAQAQVEDLEKKVEDLQASLDIIRDPD